MPVLRDDDESSRALAAFMKMPFSPPFSILLAAGIVSSQVARGRHGLTGMSFKSSPVSRFSHEKVVLP